MPKRTCTIHGHSPLVAGIPPTNLRVLWFTTWFKLSAVLILLSCTFSTANGLPQYPVICANFRDFRAPVFQVAFKAIFFVFLFTLTLKRSDLPCTLNVFGASMELQYLASTCSFSSIIITNVFLNKITQNKVFKKGILVGKIAQKTVWRSAFFVNSALMSKIHSYKLLFRQFCPLGCSSIEEDRRRDERENVQPSGSSLMKKDWRLDCCFRISLVLTCNFLRLCVAVADALSSLWSCYGCLELRFAKRSRIVFQCLARVKSPSYLQNGSVLNHHNL